MESALCTQCIRLDTAAHLASVLYSNHLNSITRLYILERITISMAYVSSETVVAIVFGIIMTVVGVGTWPDGRRRWVKKGDRLPRPYGCSQSLTGR